MISRSPVASSASISTDIDAFHADAPVADVSCVIDMGFALMGTGSPHATISPATEAE